ncbi:hypothetical protein KP509_03G004200 [Ceratopteris richardii]|nr:hypothetical protein KP509_03G004200 [Ceratopteris richardii]
MSCSLVELNIMDLSRDAQCIFPCRQIFFLYFRMPICGAFEYELMKWGSFDFFEPNHSQSLPWLGVACNLGLFHEYSWCSLASHSVGMGIGYICRKLWT